MTTLKTYKAETMAQALGQVKRDLGPQAVIMSTRTVKVPGRLGLGSKTWVEITAGDETNVLPRRTRNATMTTEIETAGQPSRLSANGLAKGIAMPGIEAITSRPSAPASVQRELHDIKLLVEGLVRQNQHVQTARFSAPLQEAYVRLIQGHVAEALAAQIIQTIQDLQKTGRTFSTDQINQLLIHQISPLLKTGSPIHASGVRGRRVIALVGPTGVGKTTTVAKLAAHYCLKENKKVGLITADTYRIAAVDQLRTYAKIIGVPLEVVLTPDQLKQALKKLQDCDVVFLDTAGRSQRDQKKLQELSLFLEAAKPDETHLVLSCNSGPAVLESTVEQFSKLGVNHVIFTKLDEAVGIGVMLNVMHRLEARLAYVTTGQDVPDDIESGDGSRLARALIEETLEPTNGGTGILPVIHFQSRDR